VPLRRSPCLTSESLAAHRANALRSTGPRTPRGKARVSFNALKHGQYAARSARLRERLIRAGYERQEELYGRIRSRIAQTFGTPDRHSREDADRLANVVWCRATRLVGRQPASNWSAAEAFSMGTKLESLTKQRDSQYRLPSGQWESSAFGQPWVAPRSPDGQAVVSGRPSWPKRLRRLGRPTGLTSLGNPASLGWHLGGEPRVVRFKFGVRDEWRRLGLIFWVQGKAYCTLERFVRVLAGSETPFPPAGDQGLERALRSKAFRLRKPSPRERWRYSLEADGTPDWTREPWKGARARVEAKDEARQRAKA